MEYRIINPGSLRFIELADGLGSPRPLRRIFSLLRKYCARESVSVTIYEERATRSGVDPCEGNASCERRRESCSRYVSQLMKMHYCLDNKECVKFYFVSGSYGDVDSLLEAFKIGAVELIGYCMVHQDLLRRNGEQIRRSYVVEAVLSPSLADLYQVINGQVEFATKINSIDAPVSMSGFYFCQQNSITNCCAHAALQMAIKSRYPGINADEITNSVFGSYDDTSGSRGLLLSEMRKAVHVYSKNELDTFSVDSHSMEVAEFLSIVYVAIESRLPVLLFFDVPQTHGDSSSGHVVALVGHTFTPNHWGAYGGVYFLDGCSGYTPSSYLAASFIINDDNIGPIYNIPLASVSAYIEYSRHKAHFEHAMNALRFNSPKFQSMKAVVAWPKQNASLSGLPLSSIFNLGAIILQEFIDEYCMHMPRDRGEFNIYFYDFFRLSRPGVGKCAERIILRPFFCSKDDYFNDDMADLYDRNFVKDDTGEQGTLLDYLYHRLPDRIWVIELSIPELFWINQKKVGEIVLDPNKLLEYYRMMEDSSGVEGRQESAEHINTCMSALVNSVLVFRVPYFLLVNTEEGGEFDKFELDQETHCQHLTILEGR